MTTIVQKKKTYSLGHFFVYFMRVEPFFAYVISRLSHQEQSDIKTAGVYVHQKRWYLLYNVNFISTLTTKQLIGLLKHECYHLVFEHCTTRVQANCDLWNIATDLAINSLIPLEELPPGGILPGREDMIQEPLVFTNKDIKRIVFEINTVFEQLPPNQSAEFYYETLQSNSTLQRIREELQQINIPLLGKEGLIQIDHSGWAHSDGESQIKARLEQILQDSYEEFIVKNPGVIPMEIRKKLQQKCNFSINWQEALRQLVLKSRRGQKRSSYKKLHRKYPYIHPGKIYRPTSKIAIYIDQSGSIHDDWLMSLSNLLVELSQYVDFYTFHFDVGVDINSETHWKKHSRLSVSRTRSGGTCFDSVERHFRTRPDFDSCWILTDGMAYKPPTCIKKRIWILFPNYKLLFKEDVLDSVITMSA